MRDMFMTTFEPGSDHPLYLTQVELLTETFGIFYEKRYPAGTHGTVVTVLGSGEMFQVSVGDDLVRVGPNEMTVPTP